VPADGFYEWQGGRAERRPLWFHDPAGNHLAFAGLAFECRGSLSFVILTTVANDGPELLDPPPPVRQLRFL
jgi:putative SOS response-associated peptidase YedK